MTAAHRVPLWPKARLTQGVWADPAPIRADLFGIERLEHHAISLAAAQTVQSGRPRRVANLLHRVKDNGRVLLGAYRSGAQTLDSGQSITPAAEWLLDNFHIVEQQLRQSEDDLPPGYYRHLPKIADGPLAGYPRVLGLAWAFVSHSDSLIAQTALQRFVLAYQTVEPLTIGELWAVAITLRIVLIENMRRLAVQMPQHPRGFVELTLKLAASQEPDQTQGQQAADIGCCNATVLRHIRHVIQTATGCRQRQATRY